jgi:hypothetical protein
VGLPAARFRVPAASLRFCHQRRLLHGRCAERLAISSGQQPWSTLLKVRLGARGRAGARVRDNAHAGAGQRRCVAVGAGGTGDGDDGDDNSDEDSDDDAEEEREEHSATLPHDDGEAVDGEDEETTWRNRMVAEAGGDKLENDIDRAIADLENGSGVTPSPSQLQAQSNKAPFLKEVIALPLSRRPMFPGTIQPITITDDTIVPKALATLQTSGHAYVGAFFTTLGEPLGSITDIDQVHPMGMLASVERMEPHSDGGMQLLLRAHRRIRITGVAEDEPLLKVRCLSIALCFRMPVAQRDLTQPCGESRSMWSTSTISILSLTKLQTKSRPTLTKLCSLCETC